MSWSQSWLSRTRRDGYGLEILVRLGMKQDVCLVTTGVKDTSTTTGGPIKRKITENVHAKATTMASQTAGQTSSSHRQKDQEPNIMNNSLPTGRYGDGAHMSGSRLGMARLGPAASGFIS